MNIKHLPLVILCSVLISEATQAQTVLSNVSTLLAGSDNTGDPDYQPGTEVVNSALGSGVNLAPGGSFEHIGQFYVAGNGIWNRTGKSDQNSVGTDYFGYAPVGIGTNTAYLGRGIQGASPNNGGRGAGKPTFGHLQLNSTGEFPVEGGMLITHSLSFNANGPAKSCLITTPNSRNPDSPSNAVVFAPNAIISGADPQNYIDGYASVTGTNEAFTLPLGDSEGFPDRFCPLTINTPIPGTVTARFLHKLQHPVNSLGTGIHSVSTIGTWLISAPSGTQVTVQLPTLSAIAKKQMLRLVGWDGAQWVDLSERNAAVKYDGTICLLTGITRTGIIALAIGSTDRSLTLEGNTDETGLVLWPNPTNGPLNLHLPDRTIQRIHILDLQGRPVIRVVDATTVSASVLPAGTYLVEVTDTLGQSVRKQFVKQP